MSLCALFWYVKTILWVEQLIRDNIFNEFRWKQKQIMSFWLYQKKNASTRDQMWPWAFNETKKKNHSQIDCIWYIFGIISYTFYRMQRVRHQRKKKIVCMFFVYTSKRAHTLKYHTRKKKKNSQIRFWASKCVVHWTLFLILSEVIDCSCSLAKIVLFLVSKQTT